MDEQLDVPVRRSLYTAFLAHGTAPSATELAVATGIAPVRVLSALRHLADERVIALQKDGQHVRMVFPLSAVPTQHTTTVATGEHAGRSYWGNCVWDALGILAMLHADGVVATACGDCSEPLVVTVEKGRVDGSGVVHFALPVRRWWEDVTFT